MFLGDTVIPPADVPAHKQFGAVASAAGKGLPMTEVSLFRLYVLRATYLLIAGGLAAMIWPRLISHNAAWPLMDSVVAALLGGVSLMALLGLRYPLQMLPILIFELVWKLIWLVAVALPLWSAGQIDPRTMQTVTDCLFGVVLVPIVLPWRYVIARFVKQPGERWKAATAGEVPARA